MKSKGGGGCGRVTPQTYPEAPVSSTAPRDESSFTAEGEEDAGTVTDSWKRNVECQGGLGVASFVCHDE